MLSLIEMLVFHTKLKFEFLLIEVSHLINDYTSIRLPLKKKTCEEQKNNHT